MQRKERGKVVRKMGNEILTIKKPVIGEKLRDSVRRRGRERHSKMAS